MATKRNTKKTQSKPKDLGFFSEIKWGESYTSLFLGAVVVVVLLVLAFSFIKSRNFMHQQTSSTSSTSTTQTQMNQNNNLPKTYTVKKGDDLWHIAQNLYGSGYNYVDLANANKLTNPSMLFAGTKLIVPDVKPKILTVVKSPPQAQMVISITGTSYIIVKGDFLWSIAIRAYGSGYKWVDIARANKLTNPDLINAGNTLIIPR